MKKYQYKIPTNSNKTLIQDKIFAHEGII